MWIQTQLHESTRSESKKCYSNTMYSCCTSVKIKSKNLCHVFRPRVTLDFGLWTLDSGRVAETVMYRLHVHVWNSISVTVCQCASALFVVRPKAVIVIPLCACYAISTL